MTKQVQDFLLTLFPEPSAHTNFCTDLYDTTVYPVHGNTRPPNPVRFSINALHPTRDLNPVSEKHRPDRPRRADCNVVTFRNILIEFDEGEPEEQLKAIITSGLPLTAITFSGKKSMHVIISLQEPLFSLEAYNALVERVYTAVEFSVGALDPSCRNASNLSRFPEVVRPDTGKLQELVTLKERVELQKLMKWVEANSPIEVNVGSNYQEVSGGTGSLFRAPSRATRQLIEELSFEGNSRHAALKKAAVQLRKSGFTITEVEDMLRETAARLIPERDDLPGLLRWIERNVRVEQEE